MNPSQFRLYDLLSSFLADLSIITISTVVEPLWAFLRKTL